MSSRYFDRVGGMASYDLCFQANMSNLASSTPSAVLGLSHTMTTNISKVFRSSSSTTGGYWLSLLKTPGASSQTSQVCQANSFLCHGMLKRHERRASLCYFLQESTTSHVQEPTSWSRVPMDFSAAISICKPPNIMPNLSSP